MFHRSALVIFTIFLFAFGLITQAAPLNDGKSQVRGSTFESSTDRLEQRDGGLLHALSYGLLAVKDGVKSTISGVQNPQVPGTKQDIEKSAKDAGQNVGSAIGNALKSGKIV